MLTQELDKDILVAMKAKDSVTLRGLRGLKAALALKRTEKSNIELTDEDFMTVVQKSLKTRRESADIYCEQNREDLLTLETEEILVLEKYLPKQASKEEVTEVVKIIVAQTGASTIKDMGKVMGLATKELAGKSDNKTISDIVRSLLV